MIEQIGNGDANESEVERIRDHIRALVAQQFSKADHYHLSQLGNDLKDDRALLERLSGRKLAEFVQGEFPYEIGRTGLRKNILYLMRPEGGETPPEPVKSQTPRYSPRFWAAFAVPLEPGQRRFLDIDNLKFAAEEESLRSAGGRVLEVEPQFIAPGGTSTSSSDIAARVAEWLETHGLEAAPFLVQRRSAQRGAQPSLLDQMLKVLTADQLRRVSLPLDVVSVLNERQSTRG